MQGNHQSKESAELQSVDSSSKLLAGLCECAIEAVISNKLHISTKERKARYL